jgi:hypothetical protein
MDRRSAVAGGSRLALLAGALAVVAKYKEGANGGIKYESPGSLMWDAITVKQQSIDHGCEAGNVPPMEALRGIARESIAALCWGHLRVQRAAVANPQKDNRASQQPGDDEH